MAKDQKKDSKVKVKILSPIGQYEEGKEYEVSEAEAKHLTRIVKVNWGDECHEKQHACLSSEFAEMENEANDPQNLTVAQALALGVGPVKPEDKKDVPPSDDQAPPSDEQVPPQGEQNPSIMD